MYGTGDVLLCFERELFFFHTGRDNWSGSVAGQGGPRTAAGLALFDLKWWPTVGGRVETVGQIGRSVQVLGQIPQRFWMGLVAHSWQSMHGLDCMQLFCPEKNCGFVGSKKKAPLVGQSHSVAMVYWRNHGSRSQSAANTKVCRQIPHNRRMPLHAESELLLGFAHQLNTVVNSIEKRLLK